MKKRWRITLALIMMMALLVCMSACAEQSSMAGVYTVEYLITEDGEHIAIADVTDYMGENAGRYYPEFQIMLKEDGTFVFVRPQSTESNEKISISGTYTIMSDCIVLDSEGESVVVDTEDGRLLFSENSIALAMSKEKDKKWEEAKETISAPNEKETDTSEDESTTHVSEPAIDETAKQDLGDSILINSEHGSFRIKVKNVHEVKWDGVTTENKIFTIQAEVENIDFSYLYDNKLSNYEICNYGISVLDEYGFSLEFYDIAGPSDGVYEVAAMTDIGAKKRVSLPFTAPEDCETISIQIGDYLIENISIEKVEEPLSDDGEAKATETTYDTYIATGETTLMNFLMAADANGYSIESPKRDGSYVDATAVGADVSFSVRYMVENQNVFMVEVKADNAEAAMSDSFKNCVTAMAKALYPAIDDIVVNDSIEAALATPDENINNKDSLFRFDSATNTLTITH